MHDLRSQFDQQLASQFPEEQLRRLAAQLEAQFGTLQNQDPTKVIEKVDAGSRYYITVTNVLVTGKGHLSCVFTLNVQNQIVGFWIKPV